MHRPNGTPGTARRRWLRRGLVFLALWTGWTLFVLRCTPPWLLETDGYYHVRVAHRYAADGPAAFADGRFAWTTASVFHRHWADIEYLFHLAVAPFTAGWHAPPVRLGTVLTLTGPSVRLEPGSSVVQGTVLNVRPAPGLPVVARLVVTAVDGRWATGRLVRDDRTAPLAAGFHVGAPGSAGVLVDLGRGEARMAADATAGPVTLLEGSAPAGTVRLGPASGHRARPGTAAAGRPFSVVFLRGQGLVPSVGAANLEDDRGLVDPTSDDAAALHGWLVARHLDPSALPATLRGRPALFGPDTLAKRGRLALAFLQVLLLAALAWILAEHEVPFALPAVGLLVLFADAFFWRFFMVRPQLLSMTLLLLGLHLAWRRRLLPLLVLGAVYALSYAAPEALLAVVTLAVTVDVAWQRLGQRRWPSGRDAFGPLLSAGLGLALGLGVHPNPANELHLLGVVNLGIGSASFLAPLARVLGPVFHLAHVATVSGLSTGMEFRPPRIMVSVLLYPAWGTALVLLGFFVFGRVRPRKFTVQALVVSLAWTALFLRSERFAEYLAPFWVLTLALALDDLRRARVHQRLGAWPRAPRRLLVVGLSLLAVVLGLRPYARLATLFDGVGPAPYRASALWMRSHLPEGAQVFESSWSATAQLLHYDLRQRFLVDLDPRYMVDATEDGLEPGQLARVYVAIGDGKTRLDDPRPGRHGRTLTLPQAIRQLFHADYVLVDRDVDQLLLSRVRADPRHFRRLREDATAALFRVVP